MFEDDVFIENTRLVGHIGLYTPINYFGRDATCSHKDGGRSLIQSQETIGQEDHVTCLKLGLRVNSSPAFLSHLQDVFSINTSSCRWLKNAGLEFTRGPSFKHVPWSSWPMVSRD